jgi:hypothetical protein
VAIPARLSIASFTFVVGLLLGCLGELPRGRSCGDGWWDPEFEDCDPSSNDRSYVSACRDHGFGDQDAECDPDTCEIRASELECTRCGDGVATGEESCDGDDLRDASCPSGSGVLRCTSQCTLDHELCTPVCGDGIVAGTEECEPSLPCADNDDCGPGQVCNPSTNECVPGGGDIGPNLSCSFYETKAYIPEQPDGGKKPYASGTVDRCTEHCFFGRGDCSFCGDGILDGEYDDHVYPEGIATMPAEVCDGDEAQPGPLELFCEPRCVDTPPNSDVVVFCEVECNAKCNDFVAPPDPDVEPVNCCLNVGSPCPNDGFQGVPDLPCCSWLDNEVWMQQEFCVHRITGQGEIKQVCP